MRILITGASRGIGAATARAFARRVPGARIALLGRSDRHPSHPTLQGTLVETADAVDRLGGIPLVLPTDIRRASELEPSLAQALDAFGGMDVLINNASALNVDASPSTRTMDLVHRVNTRATAICIRDLLPALEDTSDRANGAPGSIVTLSPPVRMGRLEWIRAHPSYTISKYAMTMHTLAAASDAVRANCLWPRRMTATAATERLERSGLVPGAHSRGRDPDRVADAIVRLALDGRWQASTLFDDDVDPDLSRDDPTPPPPLDAFVEAPLGTAALSAC